jgi:hypothetical protein
VEGIRNLEIFGAVAIFRKSRQNIKIFGFPDQDYFSCHGHGVSVSALVL